MRFLRITAIVLGCVAAPSCSGLQGSASATKQAVAAYTGHTMREFVDRYGPPNSDFAQTDNGQRAFQWDHFGAPPQGASGAPPAGQTNCRVVISALPTYPGAPVGAYDFWTVQSSLDYGCP